MPSGTFYIDASWREGGYLCVMRYILVNKPYEVLTQFTDEQGRATLKDFVDIPNIYPVGRLDFDTAGVLLLTDDGDLTQLLTHPSHGVEKVYWARVRGQVGPYIRR
jgi:23S rRNA pseudouridine2457 synthase